MRSEAKKFRTVASLIVMALSGAAGFFIGAALGDAWGGMQTRISRMLMAG